MGEQLITCVQWFQVYDEYDEEVAAAEAAEEAAIAGRTLEDKDAEIKPFLPKCALSLLAAPMKIMRSICGSPCKALLRPGMTSSLF